MDSLVGQEYHPIEIVVVRVGYLQGQKFFNGVRSGKDPLPCFAAKPAGFLTSNFSGPSSVLSEGIARLLPAGRLVAVSM